MIRAYSIWTLDQLLSFSLNNITDVDLTSVGARGFAVQSFGPQSYNLYFSLSKVVDTKPMLSLYMLELLAP